MESIIPANLKDVAAKMEAVGRTEYKTSRRPNWKEYTLIKYEGKKVISREKILIDESKIFPSDEDFFWEPLDRNKVNKAV